MYSKLNRLNRIAGVIVLLLAGLIVQPKIQAQSVPKTKITFQIKLADSIDSEPVSGRLFLFFSKKSPQPMMGPNWFGPEPFFGKDVTNVKPGDVLTIDESVRGYPGSFDDIESGKWKVQALLDHDFYFADHKNGPGNFYSEAVDFDFQSGAENKAPVLTLEKVIAPTTISDTERFKLVELKSDLLSKFHRREVIERAGVVLPASYASKPDARYPVYYVVTGFGGTLKGIKQRYGISPRKPSAGDVEFIQVYLTGQCKQGHHVYADSAKNGPRGEALIKEMIPHIDKTFRTIPESTARFVGGHSSGGWSSLWLQVTYPEMFGGVWSTAPDPVDFRDWQGTNLYENESVFFRKDGTKKPLARIRNREVLMYKDFCVMDDTLGRGGQLASFEAVFSPVDNEGNSRKCWDRETGVPFPEIVEYWKQYDISLMLRENWDVLGPKLAGKIHVYMGDQDTFYLEGATRLLGERLKELGSDAVVEMFPNRDHMNLLDPALKNRIMKEMSETFRRNHSDSP